MCRREKAFVKLFRWMHVFRRRALRAAATATWTCGGKIDCGGFARYARHAEGAEAGANHSLILCFAAKSKRDARECCG
jgi:hypothetical protein